MRVEVPDQPARDDDHPKNYLARVAVGGRPAELA